MFILTAHNVTGDGKFSRPDGTADYDAWVGINHHRSDGGAKLLRLIADRMDKDNA